MREIFGDLWNYYGRPNVVVLVTTNGFIKNDGRAVMGRGCALEAVKRLPRIDRELGKALLAYGNLVHKLDEGRIYSFPVKHNWWEKADPELIKQSAKSLDRMAQMLPDTVFILPRPGCNNGKLKWLEVKPLLTFLPDNVWVISPPREKKVV